MDALVPGLASHAARAEATRAGTPVVERRSQGRAAAAWVTDDPWATDRLGWRIGRAAIAVEATTPAERFDVAEELLRSATAESERSGIDLLVLRVHAEDRAGLDAARSAGFSVCQTELVHYGDAERRATAPPPRDVLPRDGPPLEVEIVRPDGRPVVTGSDRELLIGRAGRYERSHWAVDPRLGSAGIRSFYEDWAANVLDGTWGDVVALARVGDRVIGFYSWVLDRALLAETGSEVFHQSWAVVSEEGHGAMRSMSEATHGDTTRTMRFTECEAEEEHRAVHRSLERAGAGVAIEPVHILHAWGSQHGTSPSVRRSRP